MTHARYNPCLIPAQAVLVDRSPFDVIAIYIVHPETGEIVLPKPILIPFGAESNTVTSWIAAITTAINEEFNVKIDRGDIIQLKYRINGFNDNTNAGFINCDPVDCKAFKPETKITMRLAKDKIAAILAYQPKVDFTATDLYKINIINPASGHAIDEHVCVPANSSKFSNWQKNITDAIQKKYNVKLDAKDIPQMKYRLRGKDFIIDEKGTKDPGVEIKSDDNLIDVSKFTLDTFISIRLSQEKLLMLTNRTRSTSASLFGGFVPIEQSFFSDVDPSALFAGFTFSR